jgi:general secretion pathway protein G
MMENKKAKSSRCCHTTGQGIGRQAMSTRRRRPCGLPFRGFTMIELMIVLTIISILVSIAIPIANAAILRSKEAVLKSNLFTLRSLIDQYTADKLKAPQSLQDLVSAGYLRTLPKDPITNSSETWQTVMEEATLFPEQTEAGIFDVHSGSEAISSEGDPYNKW